MTVLGGSGEQEPRGLAARVHAMVEDQLELVPAGELAIDGQVHAIELGGHYALQLAGERAHQAHVVEVLLPVRNVPLGYHERTVFAPIVHNVLHNLPNDGRELLRASYKSIVA